MLGRGITVLPVSSSTEFKFSNGLILVDLQRRSDDHHPRAEASLPYDCISSALGLRHCKILVKSIKANSTLLFIVFFIRLFFSINLSLHKYISVSNYPSLFILI